jgi:hypothetical protein
MAEVQLIPFISWSAITAALFAAVTIAYSIYLRKRKSEPSA